MNPEGELVKKTDDAHPTQIQYNGWMLGIGERLREARLKAELTQEYVSKQLRGSTGEGQAYISKIERGQVNLTAKTMLQLAFIVGIDPNKLIFPIPEQYPDSA